MTAHSAFSASSAHRWAECPGSWAYEQLGHAVKRGSSPAAREGTGLHALADHCLRTDSDPQMLVGGTWEFDDHGEKCTMEIDQEQADAVESYINHVRAVPGVRLSEQTIDYSELLGVGEGEGFGTTDATVLDDTHLHVFDAKFGRRFVDPVGNPQMTLYAAGLTRNIEAVGFEVTQITMHIEQPRVHHTDNAWTITRRELEQKVAILRAAAGKCKAALRDFAPESPSWRAEYLFAGEHQCQWCPNQAACPELDAIATGAMTGHAPATADEFRQALSRDNKDLGRKLALVPLLEIFIDAVQAEANARLTAGEEVPGWKLVLGREGNRKWTDPAVAEAELKAAAKKYGLDPAVLFSKPTLLSPAQIDKKKLDGLKDVVIKLAVRAPAKPTLAPSIDPRSAWSQSATADDFK